MSNQISINTTTDNLAPITREMPPETGFISSANSDKITPVKSPTGKVEDRISMLSAQNDPKLEDIWPSKEKYDPQLPKSPRNTEARKARASVDEIEADDNSENPGIVENESHEELSGGRRVDPVFGVIEEA